MVQNLGVRDAVAVEEAAATRPPRYLLPPEAYFSQAWYELEQRELFARTWNLVAYDTDLPIGGSLPVEVAGAPALLTRGEDGLVRAFVNMCRHRGMQLACEAGAGATVRCPYHGWEFGLDGVLARVPQRASQFPDLDLEAWGLLPLACDTWGGMVFVNPDGAAGPLRTWLADLPDHMGPFPRTDLVEVFRGRFPIASNWKLYVENHIDCYHLWYLHEETLGMLDHHKLTYRSCGEHWVCAEPLRPGADRDRPGMLPLRGMDEDEARLTRANLIFPNVPQTSGSTGYNTYQVLPTGPETCELDLRIWAEPGSVLSDEARARTIKVLVEEDGFACAQMQRVVRSPAFAVGPLATVHERPIAELHEKLLRALGSSVTVA